MASSAARILVAGSGAIGSVFGGFLRKAGHDVTLFGRDWHLDSIRSHGLKIEGLWGSHRAAGFRLVTQVKDLERPYDLILISVKAYDTGSMVEAISPYLSEEGLAVSLQNGLGNVESLAAKFSAERSLGSSILVGAKIPEAGSVTVTVQAAPIVIGPLAPTVRAMEQCRFWISALKGAGIPCEATDEILSHLWAKVFYNAALNSLGALLQIHYGALGEEPELRAIMNGIITEAFEVAQRKKVRLLWPTVNAYLELFYGKLIPATYDHQTSMWQDLERGRRTEINALNGQVWKYGRELGFATPFNETATRLIWARERSRSSEKAAIQWFSSYAKDDRSGAGTNES